MSEDISYKIKEALRLFSYEPLEMQLKNYTLIKLEKLLSNCSTTLSTFDLPTPESSVIPHFQNRLLAEELDYNVVQLEQQYPNLLSTLNVEQKEIHDAVVDSVMINSGGRTAHSRFKIPLNIDGNSTCQIKQKTQLAELIQTMALIVWDEAPMNHRHCFEALNRTLQDLMSSKDSSAKDKLFGGKTHILAGDFRQILPIIENCTKSDTIDACITKSPLCVNFEMGDGSPNCDTTLNSLDEQWIKIPSDLLLSNYDDLFKSIILATYEDMCNQYRNINYFKERAIIAPTNDAINIINEQALKLLSS
ncbi:hypothetical protein Cni_G03017 [Canna indica]|uniref:ATP-dependent DNA helicase n=1 Tax=Canna indica TaxID=4628 RepID=A0AAQ3Q2P4_9LILI|nr:hypothetical protein Cni_G03017 [Canna indica]